MCIEKAIVDFNIFLFVLEIFFKIYIFPSYFVGINISILWLINTVYRLWYALKI